MSAAPRDDDDVPPLAELGAAWRALAAPDATAPLDAPDAATRATVEWLRDAWQLAAPPASPSLPWRLRARPLLRRASPWLGATLATAATLLLALRLLAPAPPRPPAAAPAEQLAAAPAPDPAPVVLSDRVVLRSGNVRLILFTPSAAPTARGTTPESPR